MHFKKFRVYFYTQAKKRVKLSIPHLLELKCDLELGVLIYKLYMETTVAIKYLLYISTSVVCNLIDENGCVYYIYIYYIYIMKKKLCF